MTDLAPAAELGSPPEPMPAKSTENLRSLLARAREAARAFERPDEKLGWAEALGAAPWPKGAPPAFEGDYRRAFAGELVKRGIAAKAAPTGAVQRDRAPWAERKAKETTKLDRRLLSATSAEFADHDRRWREAGARSWSEWARRKLALPD